MRSSGRPLVDVAITRAFTSSGPTRNGPVIQKLNSSHSRYPKDGSPCESELLPGSSGSTFGGRLLGRPRNLLGGPARDQAPCSLPSRSPKKSYKDRTKSLGWELARARERRPLATRKIGGPARTRTGNQGFMREERGAWTGMYSDGRKWPWRALNALQGHFIISTPKATRTLENPRKPRRIVQGSYKSAGALHGLGVGMTETCPCLNWRRSCRLASFGHARAPSSVGGSAWESNPPTSL